MRSDLSVKEYSLVSIRSDSETERFLLVQMSWFMLGSDNAIVISGTLSARKCV